MKQFILLCSLFVSTIFYSQTTISGKVTDINGEPLMGVNVLSESLVHGTTTDVNGKYTLVINVTVPFKVEFSYVGFKTKTVEVTTNNSNLNITLEEESSYLDEIVVSASRTPERIMESPVTVERMDAMAVRNTPSASFYDGLENLKGIDMNSNGLTFKSVNTRGFAAFSNTRFVQLVDGMDNSSPALNFVLGNLLGASELDIESVELLPGASSALYGANAFNGILFMNTKNPFDSEGVSAYVKSGVTSQNAGGTNVYTETSARVARKFSHKFAAKASFTFTNGTDYIAEDYDQYTVNAAGKANDIVKFENRGLAHDGLNIYGDEVATNIKAVALGMESTLKDKDVPGVYLLPTGASAYVPDVVVGMPGYKERDLTDYKIKNFKMSTSFNYRPMGNEDLEIIYNFKYGQGNTIYQGANRYNLENFMMQQHKLEFKGKKFFARFYATIEDANESYDMKFTGVNMSLKQKNTWFGTYVGAFVATGGTATHAQAKAAADATLALPGTAAFDTMFQATKSDPNLSTGSLFTDKSRIYHSDVNYNFGDVQVGGSYRMYELNSNGTIFTDYDGAITYGEYGIYTQYQKKLMDDRLKLTTSIRYDKAQNFDGNFSPRFSLAYAMGEDKNHNIRASIQSGFRNPTTQDQYIGLDVGQALLIGSAPDNIDRYTKEGVGISLLGYSLSAGSGGGAYIDTDPDSSTVGEAFIDVNGSMAYNNSYTYSSIDAFSKLAGEGGAMLAVGNMAGLAKFQEAEAALEKANVGYVQPEKVTAFEIGYRGKINKISLDVNVYYSKYENFINTSTVIAPLHGKVGEVGTGDYSFILDPTNKTPSSPLAGAGAVTSKGAAILTGDYQAFQVYTNSKVDISSYGATLGLNTKVKGFDIGFNYTYAKFDFDQAADPDFEAAFNTPEHKVKFNIGKTSIVKNLDFNVNVRWNDEYLWESSIADAIIVANTVVDAQISYHLKSLKSVLKIGATNIGGNEYRSAPATAFIGQQYYAGLTLNL